MQPNGESLHPSRPKGDARLSPARIQGEPVPKPARQKTWPHATTDPACAPMREPVPGQPSCSRVFDRLVFDIQERARVLVSNSYVVVKNNKGTPSLIRTGPRAAISLPSCRSMPDLA